MENNITPSNQDGSPQRHVLLNEPAFKKEITFVFNTVRASVAKCFIELNAAQMSANELNFMINELTKKIRDRYKSIRTEEIPTAFSNGVRGEYGEYYGLNLITFEKFIMGYLVSDYRSNLGKTLPKAEIPSPPKELTKQDRIDFAQKAYDKYKIAGFYNDLGNIIYDFLDFEKLIPFTTPEKFEMLDQARQEEYKKLQNPLSVEEARRFNIQIEALMSSNDKIIPRSKRIALNRYFKILLQQETEDIPFK
ncbi:hypothetical protein [Pedobacter antarcticus]|uniref:hypothetical protein n=1 Tax=Pedobacter antarcticus TaxID=34086 RepID=UPI0029319628|nr:hypothetical protein [Pedobacter antarcticus]